MSTINNLDIYTQRMSKGIEDKISFYENLLDNENIYFFIDFYANMLYNKMINGAVANPFGFCNSPFLCF